MTDAEMLKCSLSTWGGDGDRCRWCDEALTGRRTRWCSNECANNLGRNHWWSAARHAAKKRDGYRCVRCGGDGNDKTLRPADRGLAVHHRDERAEGRHGETSCVHHLDGLETLCQPCHKLEHSTPVSRARRERDAWAEAQMGIA